MKTLGLIAVLSAALLAAPLACARQTDAPATASASQADGQHAKKHSMDWAKPAAEAAPGGGPGKVWVNAGSKVYHCVGDKWYGRTKHGKYLDEDAAKAKGYHGPRGKGCAS